MARQTKEDAEKTRLAIMDAAERVFYKNGFSRTTLQEIADAAHVTRGAIYWHFLNKIELLNALIDRVALPQEEIMEQLAHRPNLKLVDIQKVCTEAFLNLLFDETRRVTMAIVMRRCEYTDELAPFIERSNECWQRMHNRFVHMFERLQKQNALASMWAPRVAALTLQNLFLGFMVDVLDRWPDKHCEKDACGCLKALFQSFAA